MMPDTPPPLSPGAAAAMVRGAAAAIAAEARSLPDAILRWRPGPGEWSVQEVIGHLIEADRRGFSGRIQLILDTHQPLLQAWEPVDVAAARHDDDKDIETLLGEFLTLREAGAALAAGLSADELARVGRHPKVGDLRVRDLLQEWVYHDANHLEQILSNVQGYAWPHMGNAQKFTTP